MDTFDWDNIWQVGCGDQQRNYSPLFLDYGILAVGAEGDMGPYDGKSADRSYARSIAGDDAKAKIGPIAYEMEIGHTVILKNGKSIVAIGRILGDYCYDGRADWAEHWGKTLKATPGKVEIPISDTRLDDVDGWDLRHCRKVDWKIPNDLGVSRECNSLTRSTVSRVYSDEVKNKARALIEGSTQPRDKKILPEPAKALNNEDVIAHAMNLGISSYRSEELAIRLQGLQRLANWYQTKSAYVSEHEIRAYLVWPLLQVLGWSEQCVKFEFSRRDIVIYHQPLKHGADHKKPFLIGETKQLFSGLQPALEKAEDYGNQWQYNPTVLATDGIRYLLKTKEDNRAYMNLLKLRDRHPYDADIKGAPEVLRYLLRR